MRMQGGIARCLPGLTGLLVLAWLAYRPGLAGGFLFDDFVNLNALSNHGRIDDWPIFWRYLTSGTADPTGRPIALLSFLLEARHWPLNPYPFLRDNLLLHMGNGSLLFLLLRRLGTVAGARATESDGAALLGAGLWLLHPLLVSTTLYAVQREAMLPATFTLLGLLGFVHGRLKFNASGGGEGAGWMASGIVLGTLLATLSKGNGVLLPLLAWTLDWTLLSGGDSSLAAAPARRWRRMRLLLLVLPSLVVFAYLSRYLVHLDELGANRPWTIGQRLLTQPRVLLDYLSLLAVPRSVSTGLFNDGYEVSRSLWQPWTTLPAIVLVAAIFASGFALRRRHPASSAAILFYFAGHLLESTAIPLELYFEHRNYLPALLLFWPAAQALCRWHKPLPARAAIALAALCFFALVTWQRSALWGQPERMAALWARQQPDSPRAQAAAAISATSAGRPDVALRRLAPAWAARPHDLQIAFNYIDARCALGGPSSTEKSALANALRHTPRVELLTHRWLSSAIAVAANSQCPQLSLSDVDGWLQAALRNPAIRDNRIRDQDFEPLLAQLALARHQPTLALQHFDRALRSLPSPDTAARQAAMLASSEAYSEALAHLDTYEQLESRIPSPGPGMAWVHARVLEHQGYWPREMAILREKLRAEIERGDPK